MLGTATIQLGGTDERARPGPGPSSESSCTTIDVGPGDVLLLPAGYAHRALQDTGGFTMVGSYPIGAEKWDSESLFPPLSLFYFARHCPMTLATHLRAVRFPNVMGCPFDIESIKELVSSNKRKGLGPARCPSQLLHDAQPLLDDAWQLA